MVNRREPTVHPDLLRPPAGGYSRAVVAYVSDLKRGGGLKPHSHRRSQLLAVTSGSIAVMAEGSTFVAPPERAVWVPANVVHATRHLVSTRLRTFYVRPDVIEHLPKRTTVLQISPLARELINAIVAFPRRYDIRAGRLIAALLDQIVASTELPLQIAMPKSAPLSSLANEILENPADSRSLGDLAATLGLSTRTLERQFKMETGLPFRSFRRQAKLFKALELLASGLSVSAISDEIGFQEPSAFIAMFRAAFGTTPGRYLKQ